MIPIKEQIETWGDGQPFKKMKQCSGIGCKTMIQVKNREKYCDVCKRNHC